MLCPNCKSIEVMTLLEINVFDRIESQWRCEKCENNYEVFYEFDVLIGVEPSKIILLE